MQQIFSIDTWIISYWIHHENKPEVDDSIVLEKEEKSIKQMSEIHVLRVLLHAIYQTSTNLQVSNNSIKWARLEF